MIADISIGNELVRGLFTVGAVWVGAWLGLKSHKANKWWETKQKAYEEVIELLEETRIAHRYAAHRRDLMDGNPIDLEASKRYTAKLQDISVMIEKLRSFKNRSIFMMSDRAQRILSRLWVDLIVTHPEGDLIQHDEAATHLTNALDDFVYEARLDLRVASTKARLVHTFQTLKTSLRVCATWLNGPAALLKKNAHYSFWWGWRGEEFANQICKK
ncbi:MAG: hypothetical protein V4662_07805 [Verrucomicrobiota bacterium]